MSEARQGDQTLRCPACEAHLGKPKIVKQEPYNLVPTKYGAVVRRCTDCYQLWLGYMVELPNHGLKIILKMIDKEL